MTVLPAPPPVVGPEHVVRAPGGARSARPRLAPLAPLAPAALRNPTVEAVLAVDPGGWTVRSTPGRAARHGRIEPPLASAAAAHLHHAPWTHQAELVALARRGRDVVVAAGPGTGRSSCLRAAAAERVAAVRGATVLVVAPTRADVHAHVDAWRRGGLPGVIAAYDGDTDAATRARARRTATVVVTTPEMAHLAVVANHDRWRRFLSRLALVVLDDVDRVVGPQRDHTAQLLRRLRRVAEFHGADPALVAAAGPGRGAARRATVLWGSEVVAADDDGAPRGPRLLAVHDGRRPGMAGDVLAALFGAGARSVVHTAGRRRAEGLAAALRRRLGPAAGARVGVHRGGLLAGERRAVQDAARAGDLDLVVTAGAAARGVAGPAPDAVVFDGIPDPVRTLVAELDRAGDPDRQALVVVLAGSGPLDRWFAHDPARLLHPPGTAAGQGTAADPAAGEDTAADLAAGEDTAAGGDLLDVHLWCAAAELPLTRSDLKWWPTTLDEGVRRLVLADRLEVRRHGPADEPVALCCGAGAGGPAAAVRWRGPRAPVVRICTPSGDPVGEVEAAHAAEVVHPGAGYLHQGRAWRVTELDLDRRQAVVVPDDGSTTTAARRRTTLDLGAAATLVEVGSWQVGAGAAVLETRVVGYRRTEVGSGRLLERVRLSLPPRVEQGWACWWRLDGADTARLGLDRPALRRALHAAEHALVAGATIVAGSHHGLEGRALPLASSGCATVALRTTTPALASRFVDHAAALAAAAAALLEDCDCPSGCPRCLHRPGCDRANRGLDKRGGALLLGLATAPVSPAPCG